MSRALLLGEAPSRTGDRYWRFPLSGSPARVLCQLAGIPPVGGVDGPGRWTWALYERFECRNLLHRWPGAQPSSPQGAARFPTAAGREAAERLRPELPAVVVALGRRVADALLVDAEFFEWTQTSRGDLPPAACVVAPHPSGLNRTLNDPGQRELAGVVLREALLRVALSA